MKLPSLLFLLIWMVAKSMAQNSFEKDIDQYVRTLNLPGIAIGVALVDSLIYFTSRGTPSPILKRKIGPDDINTIASLTKTFSAVAIQLAVREGKLNWEDKISSFPNRYFNTNRWNAVTTLAHCFSHTSESNPIGSLFVYNGSKYNLPFNAFQTLNDADTEKDMARRFSFEIENKILHPLDMSHTITRYDSLQWQKLEPFFIIPWNFNETTGEYALQDFNPKFITSGPAFGMMSSVNDLVKYSASLDKNILLTPAEYSKITSPFYNNSPYGLGWFTHTFEGHTMHWVYGYGFNDAAILVKIPSKNLTFIMLAPTNIPSSTTRLGYGDPLNSLLIISFLKNFVLEITEKDRINFSGKMKDIEISSRKLNSKYNTDIFSKEIYAMASLGILTPEKLNPDYDRGERLLALYLSNNLGKIDIKNPLIYELLSNTKSKALDKFKKRLVSKYENSGHFHPALAYYSGIIQESFRQTQACIRLFRSVADDDYYRENPDKFASMMWLAKYYRSSAPQVSKTYLKRIITYKEYISAFDELYNEAKRMLEN